MQDKKITLDLYENPSGIGYSASNNFTTNQTSFSISDYKNIDSISFVISDLSIINPSLNAIIKNDTVKVELIDLLSNNPIKNSMIITVGITDTGFIASKNLYKSFLINQSYNIGISVSFTNLKSPGYWVLKHASLVLLRK